MIPYLFVSLCVWILEILLIDAAVLNKCVLNIVYLFYLLERQGGKEGVREREGEGRKVWEVQRKTHLPSPDSLLKGPQLPGWASLELGTPSRPHTWMPGSWLLASSSPGCRSARSWNQKWIWGWSPGTTVGYMIQDLSGPSSILIVMPHACP